jgi:hypothetical protein
MRLAHVESLLALLQPRDDVIDFGFVRRVTGRRVHSGSGTQVASAHVPFDEARIPAGIPLGAQGQLGIVEERCQKTVGGEIAQVDRPVQLLSLLERAGVDQADTVRPEPPPKTASPQVPRPHTACLYASRCSSSRRCQGSGHRNGSRCYGCFPGTSVPLSSVSRPSATGERIASAYRPCGLFISAGHRLWAS